MAFGIKMDKKMMMVSDWALAVGAVNWGLTIFGLNLVDMAAMYTMPIVGTVVYGVIGAAGVLKVADMLGM